MDKENAVKTFIEQYEIRWKEENAIDEDGDEYKQEWADDRRWFIIEEHEYGDDKDNYLYLKVQFSKSFTLGTVRFAEFIKIPYDVILNPELSFEEKSEHIIYEEPYNEKTVNEWADEWVEKIKEYHEAKTGKDAIYVKSWWTEDGENPDYSINYNAVNLWITDNVNIYPYGMWLDMLTDPKLTWEEKIEISGDSITYLYPQPIDRLIAEKMEEYNWALKRGCSNGMNLSYIRELEHLKTLKKGERHENDREWIYYHRWD